MQWFLTIPPAWTHFLLGVATSLQVTYKSRKTEEELFSREERIGKLSEKEKSNERRNQSRRMQSIRKQLSDLTFKFGGDFVLCSSFPNFTQHTVQFATFGGGEEFVKTKYGKLLESQWEKFHRGILVSCVGMCSIFYSENTVIYFSFLSFLDAGRKSSQRDNQPDSLAQSSSNHIESQPTGDIFLFIKHSNTPYSSKL